MMTDISEALQFAQEKIDELNKQIMSSSTSNLRTQLYRDKDSWQNLARLLHELSRLRNGQPMLIVDLAELPKGTDLEQFLQTYREKGVLLIDTFNCGHQVANTRIIEIPNNKKTE